MGSGSAQSRHSGVYICVVTETDVTRARMQRVIKLGFTTAPLFLIVFARIVTSSPLNLPLLKSLTSQQSSREIEAEVARLSAQLRSQNEEERREAAMMLSRLDAPSATSALVAGLDDGSPRVRAAVATALADRKEQSVASLLATQLTKEKDVFVRKALVYALAKFRSSERTAALITVLKDKDAE